MKVGLPMHNHASLHDGHRAIIKFAKSIGEVEAIIIVDPLSLQLYFEQGRTIKNKIDNVSEMSRELKALGVRQHYVSLYNKIHIYEKKRIKVQEMVQKIIQHDGDLLLSDYMRSKVKMSLINRIRIRIPGKRDAIVRGPELVNFYMKYRAEHPVYVPPVEHPEEIIFDKIIRDPNTGLKLQSSLETLLFSHDMPQLSRIAQAAVGAREHTRPGKNEDLLKELRASYVHRPWTWEEILVWEGPFVNGRLEVMRFNIRSPHGIACIEESFYEKY